MYKNFKRMLDFIFSFLILIILTPLLLAVACLLRIHSKDSVFFVQERIGLHGKVFSLYKFRSMYSHIHGGHSTLLHDPRITPLGRFIRRTSIDELPQLLNVIRGEMSLVGPRPNVGLQIQEYTQDQWDLRNSVLPGITGLAQVEFRSLATQDQRLECDLYYVKNQSFFLDMHILVKTFFCFFSKKGN